jgi:cohesin complex subunit SA-1/2
MQLRNLDGGPEDVDMARELLLPLARSVAANWREGNRREAGHLLAHATGTGPETAKMVTATSRILKKVSLVVF